MLSAPRRWTGVASLDYGGGRHGSTGTPMNTWRLAALTVAIALHACGPSTTTPPVAEPTPAVRPVAYSDPRWGQELFASQGCVACHAPQPPALVGPSLSVMVSGTRTFEDGTTLDVSGPEGQRYLAESITAPSARVVTSFQAVMPTYTLNEAQVTALVAYMRCFGGAACEQSADCAEADACQMR